MPTDDDEQLKCIEAVLAKLCDGVALLGQGLEKLVLAHEAKLDRLQRDMDSVLALLQPPAEYVSMHNAAQWEDYEPASPRLKPSTLPDRPWTQET